MTLNRVTAEQLSSFYSLQPTLQLQLITVLIIGSEFVWGNLYLECSGTVRGSVHPPISNLTMPNSQYIQACLG
jgi:hypothetical protein